MIPSIERSCNPHVEYHDLGTDAAGFSHSWFVTGDIIQTNYHDSNRVPGSGGQFYFTGTTTAGNAGDWPNADGYFYDVDGKQFAVIGEINVLKFGAVVDGVTDDLSALAAALIYAKTIGGESVILPSGIVQFTSSITVDTACNLIGQGSNSTLLRYSGTGTAIIAQPGNGLSSTAAVDQRVNPIIEGFRLDRGVDPTIAGYDGTGLWIRNMTRGVVRDVTVGGFDIGIDTAGASWLTKIHNCWINRCNYGIYIGLTDTAYLKPHESGFVAASTRYNGMNGGEIYNNEIQTCNVGIFCDFYPEMWFNSPTAGAENWRIIASGLNITNNSIEGCNYQAFVWGPHQSGGGIRFEGNRMEANCRSVSLDLTDAGTTTKLQLRTPASSATTRSGSTATATFNSHGFSNGDLIWMTGADQKEYNGGFIISNVTTNTFDYTVVGTPASPSTGTLFAADDFKKYAAVVFQNQPDNTAGEQIGPYFNNNYFTGNTDAVTNTFAFYQDRARGAVYSQNCGFGYGICDTQRKADTGSGNGVVLETNRFSLGHQVDLNSSNDTTMLGELVAESGSIDGIVSPRERRLRVSGRLGFNYYLESTIASGAITIVSSNHSVDTEGNASTDDLDTINGGEDGDYLILRAESGTRIVTVKDNTGNLRLQGDFELSTLFATITMVYDDVSNRWIEVSRSKNNATEPFRLSAHSKLTIASGAVTVTSSNHNIDTESAAATDDLDTINGGKTGAILLLRASNGARDVVLKDGTGNLRLNGDFTLDTLDDLILLYWESVDSTWKEICRSNNA